MQTWPLQNAKAGLSELVRRAQKDGPQHITLRGKPAVVVISEQEYQKLQKPRPGLATFLRASPLNGLDIDLSRDKSPDRDVPL